MLFYIVHHYQSLTRITKAIKDGDFFTNEVLCACMDKTKEAGKALHLMGLLSDGGVHSNINPMMLFKTWAAKAQNKPTKILSIIVKYLAEIACSLQTKNC